MFTTDDYFNLANSHVINESVNFIDEEVNYILNLSEEEILELIERKDIPQELALKVADALKSAPKFSRRGQLSQKLRLYAVERNKKRLEKMQKEEKSDSYLETDMKKRKKNNEKAIEDMKKTDAHKDMLATVRKKFDEEVNEIEEGKKEFPTAKVDRQIDRHQSKAVGSWSSRGGTSNPRKTSSYQSRARKMSAVQSSVERGEDPRKDSVQGDQRKVFTKEYGTQISAKTVDNEKSAYTPGGLRAHQTKAGGYRKLTRKEELEMQEAWYSGKGSYRTTASGRSVRRDEDDATDTAVSDMLQRRREAAAKKAKQEKLKAQGLKRKDGTPVFEEVIEYLFVEGFADTIESAEVMAENISENWVNEIMEAKVDWHNRDKSNVQDRVGVLRDRNKRLQSDRPEIPSGSYQTDFRRKKHEDSRGKKSSVTEENY
jgi:hypothetical protein